MSLLSQIFFNNFILVIGYKKNNGCCRNKNNEYYDIGAFSQLETLMECLKKCDEIKECGAVSWNGATCYLTSYMDRTTSESSWKCYSKGKNKVHS